MEILLLLKYNKYSLFLGIGYNFLSVSCTVAVLEYFNNRRLTALLVAQLGPILGAIFYPIIKMLLFPVLKLNVWTKLIRFEAASAVLMTLIGASLRPLNIRMKDNPNDTLISKMFGITGLGLFKDPLFYTMAILFFFWKGGLYIEKQAYIHIQTYIRSNFGVCTA